jgi:hypothetical protein
MDVTKAVGTYIDKMLSNPAAIKVLLLDSHTVRTRGWRSIRDIYENAIHRHQ